MIQTETTVIQQIREMLDYLACNPDDCDTAKMAVQIYQLSQEDAKIADNMRSYWIEKADGAE